MKITLSKDSVCANVQIPLGEYMVVLATDTGSFGLLGGGKTYKIPATRRRTAAKTKITTVAIIPGGGASFSILMQTPKFGEWIAMLEFADGKAQGKKK